MSTLQARRLRVAVVGAGYVATHHLAALRGLDFVDVVGVCDSQLPAAQALAQRFGVGFACATLAELAQASPDAVHVLTPPASHAALAIEAMRMGCHVLVEKPMADTVADCEAMIEAAKTHGRILGVNHSDLLDPVVRQALQAVCDGRIGDVLSLEIVRNSEYPPYAGGPLPGMVTQGSYPFRDLGVHGLYTIEAFLGEIESLDVRCQARGGDPNVHFDEWQAHAATAHGVGRLLLSWNARPMENRLVVRGTRGTIDVDRFLQTCHVQRALPGPKFVGIVVNGVLRALRDVVGIPLNVLRFATRSLQPSPGIRMGAERFARAVHHLEQPPFTGADALRIAKLLEPACAGPDRERTQQLQARLDAVPPPADVLVTGAAGFLGRALVQRLRAQGKAVRVLVRRHDATFASDPGIHQVIGDLGDPAIVDHAVAGVPLVHHVGAAMRGGPRAFEAGTVWGTRNVVGACLRHGTGRLVHVSSLGVLDHAGRDATIRVHESSAYEPHPERRGAYTQTKLQAERIVLDAVRDKGLRAVVVRPGQVFGPGAERVTPNGTIALAGRWVAVGDRSRTVPLVYRDDVVDALLLASEAPAAEGRVFNVVDPEQVTLQHYLDRVRARFPEQRVWNAPEWLFTALGRGVEWLGQALKREVPLTRYRVRSLRPLANFDLDAAQGILGWTPQVGARAGLDRTFGLHDATPMGARTAATQRSG